MPKVQANGADLYYEIHGAGDPLLLIAGFACDHTIWSLLLPKLDAKCRVIVYDNRGVGQSSATEGSFTIRHLADDAAALLDALGLAPVHVAGHSMGGMIAQELALVSPERVQSLLLISSCAKLDERGKAIIEAWGELPRLLDAATATRLILPWMYTSAFFIIPGAVEQLIDQILKNPFPPTLSAIDHQSWAISAFDSSDRLSQLRRPTLVVAGSEDILLPVAYSRHLASNISGAELVVLENTGHGSLVESTDSVVTVMLDFLSRQAGDN